MVHGTYTYFGSTGNLTSTLNAVTEFENKNCDNFIACYVTVPSGSTIQFELTFDGTNWDTFSLRSTELDRFTRLTNSSGSFIGSIIGARKIRFKTTVAGSGTGSVIGTMTNVTATLESIEFGYPPHRFGFEPVHKDISFTSQQTATAIWTPASGKKVVVTDIAVIVGGTTDGILSIFNGAGDTTGNRLFRGTIAVSTNNQYTYVHSLSTPFIGAVDGVVSVTTSAAMTADIILHGYEV